MTKKCLQTVLPLLLLLAGGVLSASDLPEVVSFYPAGGCHGIYFPGERVNMVLALRNPGDRELKTTVEISCRDFFDRPVGEPMRAELTVAPGAIGKTIFGFDAPKRFGHFTVNSKFEGCEVSALSRQSAFSVLDKMEKRDPFFALDNGYFNFDLLDAYARCGIGTLELLTQMWYTSDYRDLEPLFRKPAMVRVMNSDFNLIFDFPCGTRKMRRNGSAPDAEARLRAGRLPFTDVDLDQAYKYAQEVGRLTRGRIVYYQISQEYDVSVLRPKLNGDTSTVLAEYVQFGRAIAEGVKKGNPEAKVAVLGTMGIDYFRRKPTFPLSRILLDGLGDRWDMIMIDAYSNGRVGEDRKIKSSANLGLREFLNASSQLAVSYGRTPEIINGERGAACHYDDPFDSDNCRSVACDTAQSLIVTKSTPCLFYCAHFGVNPRLGLMALDPKRRKAMNQTTDYSFIWKAVTDETMTQPRLVPRPAGVAYAITARELAFAKFSRELRFGRLCCYTFAHPDGSSVVALWSDGRETSLELDLPDGSRITDLMGVSESVSGRKKLEFNDYPQFISLPQPVERANELLAAAKQGAAVPIEGAGRRLDLYYANIFLLNTETKPMRGYLQVGDGPRSDSFTLQPMVQRFLYVPLPRGCKGELTAKFAVDDGRTFNIPFNGNYLTVPKLRKKPGFSGRTDDWKPYLIGELVVPDHVWPRSALMQEYHLFRKDGSDPRAKYFFAADDEFFYLAVEVFDKIHYQPESAGRGALNYDSLQFCFSRSRLAPHGMRSPAPDLFRADDYHFGMALTADGAKLFHLSTGPDRESGVRDYPCRITRDGERTFYEAAIPWSAIKLRRVPGGGFRFSLAVVDKNGASDNIFRSLVLTPGMTVLQDSAEFKTLVNEE
ncbi:MAG: hypothetical protein J6Y54_07895 [Lentisphaeria bacterium]|nr:hypothetical protein [Lentisphaeria bacterium]